MGDISILQLVIIALFWSGPLSGFYMVRRGPKDSLAGPLRYLNGSFLLSVFLVIALFAVAAEPPNPNGGDYLILMLIYLVMCSSWYYMIALGVLASRTGRSVIVWVGLPFITSPIGWIVAYIMMRNRIGTAMSAVDDSDTAAASVGETEEIAVNNGSDDEATVVAQVQAACQIPAMHRP